MNMSKFTFGAEILQALQDPDHPDHEALRSIESIRHEAKAELLIDAFNRYQKLEDWKRYIEQHPPSPETIGLLIVLAVERHQSLRGKRAANARHERSGGSRDKRKKIREIWASGKYSSRDICAEQECAALGMSFSTARKALQKMPDPA